MSRDLSNAMLDAASRAALRQSGLVPCTIAQVAPKLRVTIGTVTVDAAGIAGLTYTVGGRARAMMDQPNTPLIFPLA